MASFTTLADYAGVGDGYLKEEKLSMGRGGKHLSSVVNGIMSLLLGRKLQGTGLKEVEQKTVDTFVDIVSYTKGAAEIVLDYAKNSLTSMVNGNETAFIGSLNNSVAALYRPLHQLNMDILGRLGVITKALPAVPKEVLTTIPILEKSLFENATAAAKDPVPTQLIGKEVDILKSLSAAEFLLAFAIAQTEEPEDPAPKEEPKKPEEKKGKKEDKKERKDKKKKKLTHGKGTSELINFMTLSKFYHKDDFGKSMQNFATTVYDSE